MMDYNLQQLLPDGLNNKSKLTYKLLEFTNKARLKFSKNLTEMTTLTNNIGTHYMYDRVHFALTFNIIHFT